MLLNTKIQHIIEIVDLYATSSYEQLLDLLEIDLIRYNNKYNNYNYNNSFNNNNSNINNNNDNSNTNSNNI